MKYLFTFILLTSLSTCKMAKSSAQETQDISTSLNYSSISRGMFLKIYVNDSLVSITKSRNSKPVSKSIDKETWQKLNTLLSDIDLENISNLKAPTEARFYDGAAIGTLEITKGDMVYQSASFDHGTPPKEIEAVVKEILSISENVE